MLNRQQLMDVLHGEAMARCRYEIYAEIAHEEGLHYFAKVLEETAGNELSHVRELMKLLGLIGPTLSNLHTAIRNESTEASSIYPKLHDDAIADGDLDCARLFQQIAKIEARHKERFEQLHTLLDNDQVFKRAKAIIWKCRVCGYIHEGIEPPMKCPGCQSQQNFFEPDDFSI
jgi:rubrerythrin